MKHNFILVFLNVMAFSAYSQTSFVASIPNDTRMDLVRASISLSEWHEISFWTQYKDYLGKIQGVSSQTYSAIQKLAQTEKGGDEQKAFENGCEIIACRFNELIVKHQYFNQISHDHNGIIGFQFLQAEAMLDLIESARIYDQSSLRNFRFLHNAFSADKLKQAKYNMITNALSLSPKEADTFFQVYFRYEQECDYLMGETYDLFELFSVDAADLTPLVSKNHGYNLLSLMKREIKLKEKYFSEMNSAVGSSLAARFLAWEDYYSITCKMLHQTP